MKQPWGQEQKRHESTNSKGMDEMTGIMEKIRERNASHFCAPHERNATTQHVCIKETPGPTCRACSNSKMKASCAGRKVS